MNSYKRPREENRISGDGWAVRVDGLDGDAAIVNVSRKGIALETTEPLANDRRWSLELTGPAGRDVVDFYVVRCESLSGSIDRPTYLSAGLFVEKLRRRDLPNVLHDSE
jgi:hypothetical protein